LRSAILYQSQRIEYAVHSSYLIGVFWIYQRLVLGYSQFLAPALLHQQPVLTVELVSAFSAHPRR
ncbi:MAG: hypothetical protein ACRCV9_02460, partial [Burkholderiaceae bacterium]